MASIPSDEIERQRSRSHEDESGSLTAFYSVCVAVACVCMASRTSSRLLATGSLQADDWTLLVGGVVALGSFAVLLIYSVDAGLGRHWITLNQDEMLLFPKLNYAYNILNVTCFPIIKISILLLYHRIFIQRTFRRVCWACIAFVASIGISTMLVAIFSCRPIRGFFDLSVPARCVDPTSFYWACAALNVITDAIILILPLPSIWKLKTNIRRKIAISLLFMLGGLTFVISIIRIIYYLRFNPYDPSYSFLEVAYSTPAEVTLAMICACAPTWGQLTRRLIEVTRSRISSFRSSRTYYEVDRMKNSDHHKSTTSSDRQSAGRGNQNHDDAEPPLLLRTANLGTNHGVFEAKQNGLPATTTDAYWNGPSLERGAGSDITLGIPLQGIQVKREVTVAQKGSETGNG